MWKESLPWVLGRMLLAASYLVCSSSLRNSFKHLWRKLERTSNTVIALWLNDILFWCQRSVFLFINVKYMAWYACSFPTMFFYYLARIPLALILQLGSHCVLPSELPTELFLVSFWITDWGYGKPCVIYLAFIFFSSVGCFDVTPQIIFTLKVKRLRRLWLLYRKGSCVSQLCVTSVLGGCLLPTAWRV